MALVSLFQLNECLKYSKENNNISTWTTWIRLLFIWFELGVSTLQTSPHPNQNLHVQSGHQKLALNLFFSISDLSLSTGPAWGVKNYFSISVGREGNEQAAVSRLKNDIHQDLYLSLPGSESKLIIVATFKPLLVLLQHCIFSGTPPIFQGLSWWVDLTWVLLCE